MVDYLSRNPKKKLIINSTLDAKLTPYGSPIIWTESEKIYFRSRRENTYNTFSTNIKGTNPMDIDNSIKDRMTIAVAIPSFRDPELCNTIRDCFAKAAYPERVKIYVVEQNGENDAFDCHARNSGIPPFHLVYKTLHWKDAKGPTWARHLLNGMIKDEDFIMGLDSHIRFEPAWDVFHIDEIYKTKRPNHTVLSLYPSGFERIATPDGRLFYKIGARKEYRTSELDKFDNEGNLTFITHSRSWKQFEPRYAPMIAAGYYFVHSNFKNIVPWSPKTPHLFFGEEMLLSARAFTHGFDIMVPSQCYIYHEWSRGYRVNFAANEPERQKSLIYLKGILNQTIQDDEFGLGNKRSLQDYWRFIGVDYAKKEIVNKTNPFTVPNGWKTIPHDH